MVQVRQRGKRLQSKEIYFHFAFENYAFDRCSDISVDFIRCRMNGIRGVFVLKYGNTERWIEILLPISINIIKVFLFKMNKSTFGLILQNELEKKKKKQKSTIKSKRLETERSIVIVSNIPLSLFGSVALLHSDISIPEGLVTSAVTTGISR